ncbi:MAG: hypothetical protein ACOH2N_00030 [Devosia sp.]
MRDLASNLGVVATLAPAVHAATLKGSTVDLRGYDSCILVVNSGAVVSAGLFDVRLEHSDTTTDGDFTTVTTPDMQGVLPAALEASTGYKAGYVGNKRYVRAVITKQSGTSVAAGAVFVLGNAAQKPVA